MNALCWSKGESPERSGEFSKTFVIVQHTGLANVAGWLCQTADGCCMVFQRSVMVPVLTLGWALGCFASLKDTSPSCTEVDALGSTGKAPQHCHCCSCPKDERRTSALEVSTSANKCSKLKIHHNVCISFQKYVGMVITTGDKVGDKVSVQWVLAHTSNIRCVSSG